MIQFEGSVQHLASKVCSRRGPDEEVRASSEILVGRVADLFEGEPAGRHDEH